MKREEGGGGEVIGKGVELRRKGFNSVFRGLPEGGGKDVRVFEKKGKGGGAEEGGGRRGEE